MGTSAPLLPSSTILNPGFENGLAPWTAGGNQAPVIQFGDHSSLWSVFLDNRAGTDSNVAKAIDVPSTGTTTLSFWMQAKLEGCCDPVAVKIGTTTGWVNQTVDLSAHKGQHVTLIFNLHNDGSVVSYSNLDDIRVTTAG